MEHVVLLRGINVGGKNKIPMAALRACLASEFSDVRTYIQSGNVVLRSDLPAAEVARTVERLLAGDFTDLTSPVRVLALDAPTYRQVLAQAPGGFGDRGEEYRYDVGFFIDVTGEEVAPHVPTHPDVDVVTFGDHAYYHRRLPPSTQRVGDPEQGDQGGGFPGLSLADGAELAHDAHVGRNADH